MIWASCWFDGYELGYLPVLNPGRCCGKTWLIEFISDLPIMLIVEAESVCEALVVLNNDPEWGDHVYVVHDNDEAGRVFRTQRVQVHGQADCDLPYPVRYHDEGYPDQGIDPRQFAAWRWN